MCKLDPYDLKIEIGRLLRVHENQLKFVKGCRINTGPCQTALNKTLETCKALEVVKQVQA